MKRNPCIVAALAAIGFVGSPSYAAGENPHGDLSMACATCHTPDSWSVAEPIPGFDHEATGYALVGNHQTVPCASCHLELVFDRVDSECVDCHVDVHRGELDTDCAKCHSPLSWTSQTSILEEHTSAGFPLLGRHATVECEACHEGNDPQSFTSTPFECEGCHLEDYRGTLDPDHVAVGFDITCENCHSPARTVWQPVTFNHPPTFPLTGGHATDCVTCHTAGLPPTPECVSCHLSEYESAEPDHVLSGFPDDCATCHSTTSWEGAQFAHVGTFPLLGQHAQTECASCHTPVNPNPDPACIACHASEYQNAEPDHALAGFPEDCTSCHGFNDWSAQAFVHPASFPLLGQHGQTECASCHTPANPNPDPACITCHMDDYQNAQPDHVAAGFPEDCTNCHGYNNWDAQAINHDAEFFPIYSGRHRGEWNTCADCHVSPTTFATFECIFCHEHRQSEADAEHNDVNGYNYDSQSCFSCHPDGRS